MQRFSGYWGASRFGALLLGLCGFSSFYFMVDVTLQRAKQPGGPIAALLFASIPFGILALLLGFYCLYALLESFSVYTLNEEKIVKRAVYGTSEMAWKFITDIQTLSAPERAIVLTDDSGRRMRLAMEFVRDPQGALRAAIEAHLAGLRAKQRQELGW